MHGTQHLRYIRRSKDVIWHINRFKQAFIRKSRVNTNISHSFCYFWYLNKVTVKFWGVSLTQVKVFIFRCFHKIPRPVAYCILNTHVTVIYDRSTTTARMLVHAIHKYSGLNCATVVIWNKCHNRQNAKTFSMKLDGLFHFAIGFPFFAKTSLYRYG